MINWSNVYLVMVREVRDQMRDRRTLFMIFVLPLLLYPLLGMSLFQVTQFIRQQATRVLVLGFHEPDGVPKLIRRDADGTLHFADELFDKVDDVRLLQLELKTDVDPKSEAVIEAARNAVQRGEFEAVVYFPPDFNLRLNEFRKQLQRSDSTAGSAKSDRPEVPSPELFYNTAKEKSQLAYVRLKEVLDSWSYAVGRENLASRNLPATTAHPFKFEHHDVAERDERRAAMWSKILPLLLLIWALTGAFYPAIDLCAGEKERGTLETLLSSPAERIEIVWGKLLTVMLFSVATAVLNILSMGITGAMALSSLQNFGPPPPLAPLWLFIALLPMSALFSALCIALASFARSTKEGQYYLMPLVLITLPLVILPMSPGVELNLGMSLIPVTGVVLLLRAMLEGDYLQVLPYVPPIVAVTGACCLLAVRWAVDQFNSEGVLFRESERAGLGLWMRHVLRDREDTPSTAGAVMCGVIILTLYFFLSMALSATDPGGFVQAALATQLVVIFFPAMLMTLLTTRSPRKTLLLNPPPWWTVPAAMVLAVALLPSVVLLHELLQRLYPINPELLKYQSMLQGIDPWSKLLVMALAPAICEEIAFRGFILSGFRHVGSSWRAIVWAAVFFGMSHGIAIQQAIAAVLIGLVIGYLAVQSGSIFPGMAFHVVHNGIVVALTLPAVAVWLEEHPEWKRLTTFDAESGVLSMGNHWLVVAGGIVTAGIILRQFAKLPHALSYEEELAATIRERSEEATVGAN